MSKSVASGDSDEIFADDPDLDAYIETLTRDWPPPDSPAQLATLRRVFGAHLTPEPAAGHSAKNSPAAGRHSSQKDAA